MKLFLYHLHDSTCYITMTRADNILLSDTFERMLKYLNINKYSTETN